MQNDKGQITIFFSTTVLMLITFLAFIINIGIFVKAKINLQNATDAAAYAGASVQARQLTNIAYLNWEMRNIYKEWMFKYYILGGLGLNDVSNGPKGSSTDFRMGISNFNDPGSTGGFVGKDSYNFPSTCIDFAGTGSIGLCTRFVTPGLPRFDPNNVIGIDETTNAFIDSLVAEKGKDCSERTQINFFTNSAWAFNVQTEDKTNSLAALAPEIGLDRQGAFPKAFELALRIRNLESQVNKPPNIAGVCSQTSGGVNCQESITNLVNSEPSSSHERIYKAFFSGFRNLGSEEDNQMRRSFTLTEIPPKQFVESAPTALSNLLIPEGRSAARTKYYLDLKIVPVNIATFYTAFNTNQQKDGIKAGGETADSEAQCTATKIGLPVPGYPLGFNKNPEVLTYYAVRGQARFTGLFNPFLEPFVMTAYAAAKPFGGRIGPALFNTTQDSTRVFPRKSPMIKSSGYMSGLNTSELKDQKGISIPSGTYVPGAPLPLNMGTDDKQNFWITDSTGAVGGFVSGPGIFFGIPNLIYDYPTAGDILQKQTYLGDKEISIITPNPVKGEDDPVAGLYNPVMMNKFRQNLKNIGGVVSVTDIQEGILLSRAPTLYDFANYLVPSPENLNNKLQLDSFGIISGAPQTPVSNGKDNFSRYNLRLYAPIFSNITTDTLYKNSADVVGVLNTYLRAQSPAIEKYIGAMNLAAAAIYNDNISGATAQRTGREAARAISDLTDEEFAQTDPTTLMGYKPSCNSIAGKFALFYSGQSSLANNTGPCLKSFEESFREFLTNEQKNLGDYHVGTFLLNENLEKKLFSAYMPGANHDSLGNNGIVKNAFSGNTENMIRNSYSTKFIPLNSITSSGYYSASRTDRAILSEGNQTGTDAKRKKFANPLDAQLVGVPIDNIKY